MGGCRDQDLIGEDRFFFTRQCRCARFLTPRLRAVFFRLASLLLCHLTLFVYPDTGGNALENHLKGRHTPEATGHIRSWPVLLSYLEHPSGVNPRAGRPRCRSPASHGRDGGGVSLFGATDDQPRRAAEWPDRPTDRPTPRCIWHTTTN